MIIKNKTNIIILSIVLVLSLGIFLIIKVSFFNKSVLVTPFFRFCQVRIAFVGVELFDK